ncbi:2-hydroxyacid dehydrogenase [Nocardia vaccinii]|uniref:2-hydroxyacid dehydrogenase n=1 Tax=Nocardia vaccinii TaxID=1822 RepID=UPI000829E84A|nr:NAD(P)-dependent oxidoreductase [Nocardia vaccinii]
MTFRKLVVVGGVEAVLDPPHRAILDELADTLVTVARGTDPGPELADADAAVLAFAIPFGRIAIDAAPRLRYLQVASTAFDAVDVDYARERGIAVATLPDYMTEPVAQFVLAVLLEQASGLAAGRAFRREGNFFPLAFPAKQFRGSRVAVVGLGTIGRRVAEMAAGLGAEVRYWSRHRKDDSGFRYQDLDALLCEADFVSVNLALTDRTRGVIDAARIAALAPGTVLVCTAPLELIDLPALRARTETGDVRAILNHALPGTIADFEGCPGFVDPPLVYLTDQSRALMQAALVTRLREWAALP